MMNKKTVLLLSALCLLIFSVHVNKQSEEEVAESGIVTEAVSENANEITDIEIPENAVYKQIVTEYSFFGVETRTVNIFDESDNMLISALYDSEKNEPPTHRTIYTYDTDGKLIEEDFYASNNLLHHTVYEYDENGTLISDTSYYDNTTNKTEYTYDGKGRLSAEITYKNEHESWSCEYEYDRQDKLISRSESSGACYYYKYDLNGNIIEERSKYGGMVTEYTYDEENRMIKRRYYSEDNSREVDDSTFYKYEYEKL